MRDSLSMRLTLATAIVGLGLSTSAWADPPPPQPSDPVEETIKPQPPPPLPDDPPPHEGTMIDIPYIIEPPDLLLIEILEALPGRPISGERLVRPDGMISLGFYGDVYVRGLTLPQAKEKIIRHMRRFLNDEVLGLIKPEDEDIEPIKPLPGDPAPSGGKSGPKEEERGTLKSPTSATGPRVKTTEDTSRSSRIRRTGQLFGGDERPQNLKAPRPSKTPQSEPTEAPALPPAPPPISTTLPLPPAPPPISTPERQVIAAENVRITIIVQGQSNAVPPSPPADASLPHPPPPLPDATSRDRNEVHPPLPDMKEATPPATPASADEALLPDMKMVPVRPVDSESVFVDVTAYNSKNYYVSGDVANPGRLPWTGHDTVADALNYAGGLLHIGDPRDIRLIRPGRGGKPAKIYKVDWEGILERGEIETNYQLFPGDRLIVGRNPVEKTKAEIDRIGDAMQTVVNSIRLNAAMAREITQTANPATSGGTSTMTPEQREAIVKAWADFWWQVASRPEGAKLDEKTFRDALMRALNPPAAEKTSEEKK